MFRRNLLIACVTLLLTALVSVQAQEPTFAPAEIVNDEGGPVVITGEMIYTNPFFTSGVAQPVIILEDQSGFVARNLGYVFPPESQVFGQFTTDFYSSPVGYSIPLPIEPQAPYNDVDQDSGADTGVQVYAVAYWTNVFGAPVLEQRDQGGGGWSSAYASTDVDPTTYEIEGGKLLVYAPDDQQGFPSGFGEDGLLFTEDDPIVGLPQGYTIVDLDSDPFTFDRSREVVIDTIEPTESALVDFSGLSYTEAFDAMIEKFRTEYAFTENKNLDWNAISDEFRPRFEAAEEANDRDAYALALRDFSWAIPDGHVAASIASPALDDEFLTQTAGGLGLSLVEYSDGRVIVSFVLPGGPAEEAGIELGAEISEINGQPIAEAISASKPFSLPFSTGHALRLQQLRYVIRFPMGTDVEMVFQNEGDAEPTTATLTPVEERQSFGFSSFFRGVTGTEPPVTYEYLDSGYGYAKIWDFLGNEVLTVQMWEQFLSIAIQQGVPGIIVDMRQNGGGNGFLAEQLAGYFFQEETVIGYTAFYDPETGEFVTQTERPDRVYPPQPELRYEGQVVVLVGPACASACESFSYAASLADNVTVMGQYPSAGLGGSVEDFLMPDGATIRFTIGRGLGADEVINIEGIGVVPDIVVPVDQQTVFEMQDAVLEFGVRALDEALGVVGGGTPVEVAITEGGEIALGAPVEGEIAAGERIQYALTVETDAALMFSLTDAAGELDTYLRVYDAEGSLLAENDDIVTGQQINSVIEALEVTGGSTVIVEVGTYDDAASGSYTLEVSAAE